MRRVVLAAFGSYGDLHPILGVALALKARGVQAIVASHPDYRAKVEASGLDFQPAGPAFADLQAMPGLTPAEVIDRVARDQAFLYRGLVAPTMEAWIADIAPAIGSCDAVVATALAYAADIAAQKCATPLIAAALSPAIMMSAHDPMKMPGAPFIAKPKGPMAVGYNRAVLAIGRMKMAPALAAVNAVYRRHGLTPQADIAGVVSARLTLALYSPLLMAPQPDNPPHTHVTGFPFYDSEDGGPPRLDPRLSAFLDAGPAPLVFSLGSVVVHDGDAFYRAAIAAAKALRQRCVILCGPDSPLLADDFGADVCICAYAPHSLLFPRARAVVHHGGIGSTGQALRAGKPQLITPAMVDQFDNGWRCARLGVARTLDYKAWTAGRARTALKAVLASERLAERARVVAGIIATETGADTAAELILHLQPKI